MENSSEYYYKKLETTDTPGHILAALYCTLYDKRVTRSEIIMCNKLTKIFGRFTTFFAIMDMYGTYPNGPENVATMLYTICKKRFETTHIDSTMQSRQSLDSYILDIQEQVNNIAKGKHRTSKIPSPEGLRNDG